MTYLFMVQIILDKLVCFQFVNKHRLEFRSFHGGENLNYSLSNAV
jgi:hypothetical protein